MTADPFADLDSSHPLLRRRNAAQATFAQWGKCPLRLGEADCVRMVASHLRRLGYRVRLPRAGAYRTVHSARRALRDAGHEDLGAAVTALGLEEIAPAAALVGDIIELPSAIEGLGALTIAMGNGRVCGWWGEGAGGAVIMQPTQFLRAWRVVPRI